MARPRRSLDPVPIAPLAPKTPPSSSFIGPNGANGTDTEGLPDQAPSDPIGANGAIGTAPAISAEELRASFTWIAHRLEADQGRTSYVAQGDALAILKGIVSNDPRMLLPQPIAWRCINCDESGSPGAPLVPVLAPIAGEFCWLHLGCHDAHCRRQAERVDDLLRGAGLLC